jgi:murein L,D-transpeptidase YafK
MTKSDLKTGSYVWRVIRVIAWKSRWVIPVALLAMLTAGAAVAQDTYASEFSELFFDTTSKPVMVAPAPVAALPIIDTANALFAAKSKLSQFAINQLENDRVLNARIEKRLALKQLFRERGLAYPAPEILMRVFKREREFEIWVRPEAQASFVLLKTYEICALSDKPGPKRTRGDYQTPEGFYYINDFNPQSGYHLSMKVDYPNQVDRILGAGKDMGGDIFIHGGCKTAGCMAVTDDNIKEIYWLAVEARDHGQTHIPVHIYPARLSDLSLKQFTRAFSKQPDLISFWTNLKSGYDYFERHHTLPGITVSRRGRYLFNADPSGLLGQSITPTTNVAVIPSSPSHQ